MEVPLQSAHRWSHWERLGNGSPSGLKEVWWSRCGRWSSRKISLIGNPLGSIEGLNKEFASWRTLTEGAWTVQLVSTFWIDQNSMPQSKIILVWAASEGSWVRHLFYLALRDETFSCSVTFSRDRWMLVWKDWDGSWAFLQPNSFDHCRHLCPT